MDSFIMRVAGVTFDGRQRIIANLKVGEKLYFEPQPNNPYDCYAVEIFTTNRSSVGYIPKGENQTIFRNLLDKKAQYSVTVVAITGGGSYNYGLSIKVDSIPLCNANYVRTSDTYKTNISETKSDATSTRKQYAEDFQEGLRHYYCGDKNRGYALLRKVAISGHSEAQYIVGFMLYNGEYVQQNYKEATEWFLKAAKQGHSDAQDAIAYCFLNGIGIEQNYTEGLKWTKLAAEHGIANAYKNLAVSYSNGFGVSADESEATKYYLKAAELGDADSQLYTGNRYMNGTGIDVNFQEAAKWYEKAANQDNIEAMVNLASLYLQGKGVSLAPEKAVELLQVASAAGEPHAQYNLGICYWLGNGILKDEAKALKLITLAANNGHEKAQIILRENIL